MEGAADGAAARTTAAAPGGGARRDLSGYIVDLSCAKRGKGMWANAECVARCVRDGDKVVLVTEEGKIFQISNQDKITPESYGQVVTLTGKTDGDTITVDSLKCRVDYWQPVGPGTQPESILMLSTAIVSPFSSPVTTTL